MIARPDGGVGSVERVATALGFGEPDRVPVDLHNFQLAARASGLPMGEVMRDGALLAEAMLVAWREFGQDMVLLESGTGCSAEACGVEVRYMDEIAPVVGRPVLRTLGEVADLEVPDPYTTFPMSEILKATRILGREIGDRAWVCARADQGPAGLAAQLRGMGEFLMDLASEEDEHLVHALVDYSRRVATRYALALIDCGGRSTSIGESVVGPAVVSPRHYRHFALGPEQRMVAELSGQGVIVHIHICGATERITEDFIATGARVLEVDHKTDIARLKQQAQGKACVLGNIDTSLLAFGTPGEVELACREVMERCRPRPGLILGPGCAMAPGTPADNVHAIVEAAKRWGAYKWR